MADQRFHHCQGPFPLEKLAVHAQGALPDAASAALMISDVAPLDQAGAGQISFLDNIKYKEAFLKTKAAACIVSPEMAPHAPTGVALIVTKNPYRAYAKIAQLFYPDQFPAAQISDRAHIDPSAKISAGCVVEVGAVIGAGAQIGEGCWIEANAVIRENVILGRKCRVGANASLSHTIIGDAVRIYPGCRIGQDGFGFAIDPAGHVKVPQLGRVMIGDHVEIGANTTIDRGAGPDTVIGAGTWIDNLVQIGHNVRIGKGCVIVSQVGISGSTVVDDYVMMAGQVGVAGHLHIGKGAKLGAKAGVMRDIEAGAEVMGAPAIPTKQFMRQVVALTRLAQPNSKKGD